MSHIEGKVVAITGASSGIGEATALLLAERGAKVVLGARRPDRLEALTARIVKAGGHAAYAPTDVKRREDLHGLVDLACDRYGRLDVLVSNAGVGLISPMDELRVEDWEEMIDVNLKGVLYGIAAALPVFRRQDSDTSSTPSPPPGCASCRASRCTPRRRTPSVRSRRACARRPAAICA